MHSRLDEAFNAWATGRSARSATLARWAMGPVTDSHDLSQQ